MDHCAEASIANHDTDTLVSWTSQESHLLVGRKSAAGFQDTTPALAVEDMISWIEIPALSTVYSVLQMTYYRLTRKTDLRSHTRFPKESLPVAKYERAPDVHRNANI